MPDDCASGITVKDMCHEPVAPFSGSFKGIQSRWPAVDKEGVAVVSRCKRVSGVSGKEALRKIVGYACPGAYFTLPLKSAAKNSQLEAFVTTGLLNQIHTTFGMGQQNSEGLFHVSLGARHALWTPDDAKRL